MKILRRLAGGAVIMLIAAFLLPSTSASAGGGFERCPKGYYCVFDGPDGTGTMAYFKYGAPNLSSFGLDNRVSSKWNRIGWNTHFCFFDDYKYQNLLLRLGGTAQGPLPTKEDNRASSIREC